MQIFHEDAKHEMNLVTVKDKGDCFEIPPRGLSHAHIGSQWILTTITADMHIPRGLNSLSHCLHIQAVLPEECYKNIEEMRGRPLSTRMIEGMTPEFLPARIGGTSTVEVDHLRHVWITVDMFVSSEL